jgi:hypothetical protein
MEFVKLSWLSIALLEILGIAIVAFGIKLLNQPDGDNSENNDPWNQPLAQQLGFSLTLTGIFVTLGMLVVILMKLMKP